jgi:hypothetical protein
MVETASELRALNCTRIDEADGSLTSSEGAEPVPNPLNICLVEQVLLNLLAGFLLALEPACHPPTT